MNLFTVTINHPRGGTRARTIAAPDAEAAASMCHAAGLNVASSVPKGEPTVPAPAKEEATSPPSGRLYGKSAQGPRRNAAEMAQDRLIDELAKQLGYEIPADVGLAADLLEADLRQRIEAYQEK